MHPEEDSQQQPAHQPETAHVVDSSTQSLQGNQGPQPPTSPEQQIYAGFWIRWAALFIDVWVGIIPSALIAVILVLPLALISGEPLTKAFDSTPVSILFNGITAILVWFYFIFMTYKYGATLGKMALKLKVTTTDGQPLTLQKVIIREVVGKFLSGFLFSIGYLIVAFSKKKQGLHDHLAGTYVIQTQPVTGAIKFVIALSTLPLILGVMITIATIVIVFMALSGKVVTTQDGKPVVVDTTKRLAKARDTGRKGDITQLAAALSNYNSIHNRYPVSLEELVTSGDVKYIPTPMPNSEPPNRYAYVTCLDQGTQQAIIYTKSEESGNYIVYRTITQRVSDSGSAETPVCP